MDGDNLTWSIEYYEANTESCNSILEDAKNFEKIPLINDSNIHKFKDGDLVRYVGMVQEILNPEYYPKTYDVLNLNHGNVTSKSGRYRDFAVCENLEKLMLDDKQLEERGVYFLIPIPHTSKWVDDYLKKSKEDEGKPTSAGQVNRKRPAPDNDIEENDISYVNHNKFIKTRENPTPCDEGQENVMDAIDMYYPLHKRTGLPCVLKFPNDDKYNIVMNDRIEVVGFLGLDPAFECNGEDASVEERAVNPPSSLLPRLHGITCRKLKHNNPLLGFNFNCDDIISTAEKARSDLHLVLSQVLNEDPLAADYIICYLLSRVFLYTGTDPVGNFTFNLCKVQRGSFTRRLYRLIDSVVTNSHYLPLSIATLNEMEFRPKKNYDYNRLFSGRMQFSEGTYLMVDETVMNEGQLDHIGTSNFSALDSLVKNQVVDYNFLHFSLPYTADVPVLIVSEGSALLKGKVALNMKQFPDEESITEAFDAADAFLQGQVIEDIRKYLTCMRLQDFNISEDLAARASDDFVKMRQSDRLFTTNDFDVLLTLSRLLALSYGRTSLAEGDWLRAVEMEKERKLRHVPRP